MSLALTFLQRQIVNSLGLLVLIITSLLCSSLTIVTDNVYTAALRAVWTPVIVYYIHGKEAITKTLRVVVVLASRNSR